MKTEVQGAQSLLKTTMCVKMLVNNIGISSDLKNVYYYQFLWLAIRKIESCTIQKDVTCLFY